MRKSFSLLAAICALGAGLMTGNANAFSPAPPPEPKSDVILVLGGCGPGYYPDAYGQCVPRPYYGGPIDIDHNQAQRRSIPVGPPKFDL